MAYFYVFVVVEGMDELIYNKVANFLIHISSIFYLDVIN